MSFPTQTSPTPSFPFLPSLAQPAPPCSRPLVSVFSPQLPRPPTYLGPSTPQTHFGLSLFLPPPPPPEPGAYIVSSPPGPEQTVPHSALAARSVPSIRNLDDAAFVAYQHRAFGSPAISTFVDALRYGWIRIRRLTSKLVTRNPPLSAHTAFGHLDAQAKNVASTRPFPPHVLAATRSQTSEPPDPATSSYDITDSPTLSATSDFADTLDTSVPLDSSAILDTSDTFTYHLPYSLTVPRESWCAGDATGRFSPPSRLGHEYLLVTVFHGYIFAVPMINRSSKSYVKAYSAVITFFSNCGHPFTHLSLDNEKSADLTALFKTHKLSIQYVPPQQHRANPAERAIRTYKNHFIAILSAVHPSFPADLWHLLLPITELTLNHLRPWTPNRKLSAHHGLHGHRTDLLAHPLHPPGQLVVAHSPPESRASWDHHGVRAFYLGPALDHYRSHRVYVVKTGSNRVTDTLAHFPIPLFHFAPPDPIPPDLPSDSRPDPQHDGSDLIGRWFHEPELGTCSVIGLAPPLRTSRRRRQPYR